MTADDLSPAARRLIEGASAEAAHNIETLQRCIQEDEARLPSITQALNRSRAALSEELTAREELSRLLGSQPEAQ